MELFERTRRNASRTACVAPAQANAKSGARFLSFAFHPCHHHSFLKPTQSHRYPYGAGHSYALYGRTIANSDRAGSPRL